MIPTDDRNYIKNLAQDFLIKDMEKNPEYYKKLNNCFSSIMYYLGGYLPGMTLCDAMNIATEIIDEVKK